MFDRNNPRYEVQKPEGDRRGLANRFSSVVAGLAGILSSAGTDVRDALSLVRNRFNNIGPFDH